MHFEAESEENEYVVLPSLIFSALYKTAGTSKLLVNQWKL